VQAHVEGGQAAQHGEADPAGGETRRPCLRGRRRSTLSAMFHPPLVIQSWEGGSCGPGQDLHDGVLGHADAVAEGHLGHGDAPGDGRVQVDVVRADAGGDGQLEIGCLAIRSAVR
jgi:hypothetical protein